MSSGDRRCPSSRRTRTRARISRWLSARRRLSRRGRLSVPAIGPFHRVNSSAAGPPSALHVAAAAAARTAWNDARAETYRRGDYLFAKRIYRVLRGAGWQPRARLCNKREKERKGHGRRVERVAGGRARERLEVRGSDARGRRRQRQ